jgi:hypothetical protein
MKNSDAIDAHSLQLALEAGLVGLSEVIAWADGVILNRGYDEGIANVSLATQATEKEMIALLRNACWEFEMEDEDKWSAVRKMLGRMHESLVREPQRLPDFTRFLEQLWIRCKYEAPKDLSFIAGLEDDYLLAVQGHFGCVEEVRTRLVENLARFRY